MSTPRMNKKRIAALSLAIAAALNLPAYAAEEAAEVSEVLVTATRTEQELKDVPAAAEVITREQIQAKGAITLRQALETAAGISFGVDGMKGSSVSIRGFDSKHVLILIDGRRISGETSLNRANSFEIDRISMENVERIEIIRGASSALYGSDALGGVINIVTKRPEQPQLTLELEGHKADAFSDGRDWSLRYDAGRQGRFGWSLSAGERREDPFTQEDGIHNNYYGTRRPLSFQGEWQTSETGRVTLGIDYLDEQTKRTADKSFYINDNQRTDFNIGYEGKAADTDYKIRFYQSVYDKDIETRSRTSGALSSFDIIKRTINTVEANAATPASENHLMAYGLEYRQEKVRGTRIDSGKNPYTLHREGKTAAGSEAALDYYAAYVQDEWDVNGKLLLVSALRYDDSDQFASAVSPKMGATYKLQPNSRLKANVGYGFKIPTTTELYHAFLMAGKTYFIGNPDLDPERSVNYDFSWEGESGPLSGKVGVFRSDIKDMIESYEVGPDYPGYKAGYKNNAYGNIAQAQLQGVEAEIGRSINDYLAVKANYTYLDAENKKTHVRLEERARHLVGASLLYSDRENGVNGNIWGTWNGDWLDSDGNAKSYAIWNALVSKELNAATTVYLGVDNIFNYKDYDRWINGTIYRTGVRLKF